MANHGSHWDRVGFLVYYHHHHHHRHLFFKCPFLQLGPDVFPDMKSLHISLNTTHSGCKLSSSISSLTHSLQVFLPLLAHLTPATITFLQADYYDYYHIVIRFGIFFRSIISAKILILRQNLCLAFPGILIIALGKKFPSSRSLDHIKHKVVYLGMQYL